MGQFKLESTGHLRIHDMLLYINIIITNELMICFSPYYVVVFLSCSVCLPTELYVNDACPQWSDACHSKPLCEHSLQIMSYVSLTQGLLSPLSGGCIPSPLPSLIIVQPGQGGIVSPLSQIGCRLHPIPPLWQALAWLIVARSLPPRSRRPSRLCECVKDAHMTFTVVAQNQLQLLIVIWSVVCFSVNCRSQGRVPESVPSGLTCGQYRCLSGTCPIYSGLSILSVRSCCSETPDDEKTEESIILTDTLTFCQHSFQGLTSFIARPVLHHSKKSFSQLENNNNHTKISSCIQRNAKLGHFYAQKSNR